MSMTPRRPADSGRVSTRNLVRIGQRWRLKTRKKIKPEPITIRQIHRADRQVEATYNAPPVIVERISFADLRRKYELLDDSHD